MVKLAILAEEVDIRDCVETVSDKSLVVRLSNTSLSYLNIIIE